VLGTGELEGIGESGPDREDKCRRPEPSENPIRTPPSGATPKGNRCGDTARGYPPPGISISNTGLKNMSAFQLSTLVVGLRT
jgi:hypothetical protein